MGADCAGSAVRLLRRGADAALIWVTLTGDPTYSLRVSTGRFAAPSTWPRTLPHHSNYGRRALVLLFENRDSSGTAEGLEALAGQALQAGEPIGATRLAGAAERVRPEGLVEEGRQARLAEQAQRLQTLLGIEVYRRELQAGRRLSDAQVLDLIADCPAPRG